MICPSCTGIADRAPLADEDLPPYRSYKCSCGMKFTTIEVELAEYRKQILLVTTSKILKEKHEA
jgi:hypothetical protein